MAAIKNLPTRPTALLAFLQTVSYALRSPEASAEQRRLLAETALKDAAEGGPVPFPAGELDLLRDALRAAAPSPRDPNTEETDRASKAILEAVERASLGVAAAFICRGGEK